MTLEETKLKKLNSGAKNCRQYDLRSGRWISFSTNAKHPVCSPVTVDVVSPALQASLSMAPIDLSSVSAVPFMVIPFPSGTVGTLQIHIRSSSKYDWKTFSDIAVFVEFLAVRMYHERLQRRRKVHLFRNYRLFHVRHCLVLSAREETNFS